MSASVENQILLNDDQFWVTFRGRRFGPFEYQWSNDLHGVEFHYRGSKFGEVCGDDEFFADLQPYGLPLSVCQVATLTLGTITDGLRTGDHPDDRITRLLSLLLRFGLEKFLIAQGTRP